MAGRIRSIKPEILDDEEASGLSDAAWRLWVSMWLLVDDAGNTRAGDRYLAAQTWQDTARAKDVPDLLAELVTKRRVITYESGGERYAQIRNWGKHQRIDNAGKPRVPGPEHETSTGCTPFRGEPRRTSESLGDSPLDQRPRPTTSDLRPRPPDSGESGSVPSPLTLVPIEPPAPRFDFVAVYKAHYPRKEGRKRGLEICQAEVRNEADFQSWQRAVQNFAALMRSEGRPVDRTKHFDSFMAVWRDYVDMAPSSSGPMDAESAEKGRALF